MEFSDSEWKSVLNDLTIYPLSLEIMYVIQLFLSRCCSQSMMRQGLQSQIHLLQQMTQIQVKSSDVVKLILQFLKQNNYQQSFDTLQKESKLSLNTVNSSQLANNIMLAQWDVVLSELNSLMPTEEHLFNLYQLIVDDLIQNDRYQAAAHVIKAFIHKNIKNIVKYRQKIMRLEYIIEHPDQKALHKKVPSETRKIQIIKQILHDVHEDVDSGRLLKLLGDALRYQAAQGLLKPNIKLSLFEGRQQVMELQQQTIVKSISKMVKFPEDTIVSSMCLSWSQQSLALGGRDGLIQIYNMFDYSYHTGLKFQSEGVSLFHDSAVLIMQFSYSDEMLVSSDDKGIVKIWNMENGKLLRKIESQGVCGISWGMDASHLLIGKQDIKLYGIRSCVVLKEYNMNSSDFINRIVVNQHRVFGITNGGIMKVFDYGTQEELMSVNFKVPVLQVVPILLNKGSPTLANILISTSNRIFQLSGSGEELEKYQIENGELVGCLCAGEFIYEFIKGEDKKYRLNVISRSSGKTVYYCALEGQILFGCLQKNRNLMVTYDDKNCLNFWRQST